MTQSVKRIALIGAIALGAIAVGAFLFLKGDEFHHMAGHGAMHTGRHDEVNMPGLRGKNVTEQETAELRTMFRNFDTITREVQNLPNGIRTVTRSPDAEVMDQLVSHVVGMIDRVDTSDDPEIIIQSPTLDVFFSQGHEISTEIDIADIGIVVVQTSENPIIVEALQKHAAEVSDMADRGMEAVHEMMAGR
ncbi:MAG: hypothetical protein V7661_17025 [Sulfitobacter sp.]